MPGFRVVVSLTPKAERELAHRGERLRVFGDLFGYPKPAVRSRTGEVDLGRLQDKEFAPGEVAEVSATRVNQAALPKIEGTVQLLVNVVSARRTSADNLLSCDFYQGPAPTSPGKVIAIHCGLIVEKPPTSQLTEFSKPPA